jgi:hypothetical protein
MKLTLWLQHQADLVRMLDDAHRALRQAHEANRVLSLTGQCAGRAEHVRLAHRLEVAETRLAERLPVLSWEPVTFRPANHGGNA